MAEKGRSDLSLDAVHEVSDPAIRHGSTFGADEDPNHDEVYSYEEQRKIVKRIDRRVVTVLASLYAISLIDRINVSTANIAGMSQELKTQVGFRYSIIILTFFVAYTVFQPLATVLIRKIGPRWFLSSLALAWSVVMVGSGFVHSWQQLAGLRFLVGTFEAGYFPGAVYLLSTWYTRYDMQVRYSLFYTLGCMATAFSGILGYGFSKMNGVANLGGWRWIFIMEGIISALVALNSYIFLVGFPEEADKSWDFLSRQERDFVIRKVNRDRGDAITEPFTYGAFFRPALDLKIWVFAFMFFCVATVSYSINYFLPIILLGLGFNTAEAQCLIAPPWIFTGLFMLLQAWISDKYHLRAPIIAMNAILAIIGIAVMGFDTHNSVRYFGVFLVIAGGSGNIPPVLTYQANNIRGHWKRAFCSATLVGFGGIGGISGALIFRAQDAPKYLPGLYACIVCNICVLLCVLGLTIWFWYCNKRARRGIVVIEGRQDFLYTY